VLSVSRRASTNGQAVRTHFDSAFPELATGKRSLCRRENSHALGIERKCLNLGFGTVGGDFFAIPEEGDSRGIANSGYDFSRGTDRRMRRRDQCFLADGLTVRLD
jgi:hypothetical protein